MSVSLVWMRRNLRLRDNKSLYHAIDSAEKVIIFFIFDENILKRFSNPKDSRLSFIADILFNMNNHLNKIGGEVLAFFGNPRDIIPKLCKVFKPKIIFADEDFEELNILRDQEINRLIEDYCEFKLLYDHLLMRPGTILKKDRTPYKIYSPFMKEFLKVVSDDLLRTYNSDLRGKIFKIDCSLLTAASLQVIDLKEKNKILSQIGYIYNANELWPVGAGDENLNNFVENKVLNYHIDRSFPGKNSTSNLSPYLRFGLVSVRQCFQKAFDVENSNGCQKWVSELIWREFYACIMYHFPETRTQEFQIKYRNVISWNENLEDFRKFTSGMTGYPIIDAAVRQLTQNGWMHNRMRMIVASFLTKNLLIDWRFGEEFFAQHLMDYELSTNVGGWQWASSCGTDPQPYFRVFNPFTQGQKFDQLAKYVKEFVPELQNIEAKKIHNQKAVESNFNGAAKYPAPMIDYKISRLRSIEIFREASFSSVLDNN
ncbi:MAG: cryptochrome/photolyase family protein [Janthinobacterium lividum]